MWSRISLRTRVTLLTMCALTLVTASLTVLSIYNAQRHFVIPMEVIGLEMETIQITPRYEYQEIEMPLIVTNTGDITAITRTSQAYFQNHSIIVAAVFVLVGTLLAYIISGQALKPVNSLANRIESINENNLDSLIEPPKSNDEISRLTHSFNNMLAKLNRSFENQKLFAQNAAHELKTPLASIMTNIDVLQLDDEPSAEEYKDVVDTVKDSTKQLIKLVDGLLTINAIVDETGWQSFRGKGIFSKIVNDLDADIKRKNLSIDIIGDCHIRGDKMLLERAYLNLVHNAVRYNVENGVVIITLTDGNISIEDSGIGIPQEDLVNIFEPLYCVDKSRSKMLGGHGLGMAIAKGIFDKHRIKIRILSEVGTGTKIFLTPSKI